MAALLETIELEYNPSQKEIDATVIWLHGLGADGHDFEAIVPELNLPREMAVRFVFPHAPIRAVTINMGYEMRSWYDILSMSEVREINEEQLQQSCDQLLALIDREVSRGINTNRIILAGFSQGGAVAMSTATRFDKPLAGIMALSTYIPVVRWLDEVDFESRHLVPVFMGHGTQDPVVSVSLGLKAQQQLEQRGYSVEWHDYEMPHSVCMDEIRDIADWMARLLD